LTAHDIERPPTLRWRGAAYVGSLDDALSFPEFVIDELRANSAGKSRGAGQLR